MTYSRKSKHSEQSWYFSKIRWLNIILRIFPATKNWIEKFVDLKQEFQKRFSDMNSKEIRMFQNLFGCNVAEVSTQLQTEIIDLQANEQIKEGTREFPNLKFAISMFGTTYECEQTFSRMKYLKLKTGQIYRMRICSIA